MRGLSAFGSLLVTVAFVSAAMGQVTDATRLRALREKDRSGTITSEEKAELDRAMELRAGRPATPPANRQADDARRTEVQRHQAESLERMRPMGRDALKAAALRTAPDGPGRDFHVNNETGDDRADGFAAATDGLNGPVRTFARAVSLLRPGDTLHLAVTGSPYRETLRLGDDFGGVPGKPIVIDGHGATILGCDPLRPEGWEATGTPGLYRSAKFLSELEEFTDEAKLGRVFFVFDGVVQHMGRSMKGMKARFKVPGSLKPGEWTYVEAEKAFYLRVAGALADAKVEAPYRRNGVAIRAPKVASTQVIIKDLIVCRVLNDGFNLHGTTSDFRFENIAAFECGDDGISPHETCEVEIDGYWGVGNSTGMGNGYLSVTKARNIRLEGNLGHQYMSAHGAITELRDSLIVAGPGTDPINVTNAQNSLLTLENVQVVAPAGRAVRNVAGSTLTARRVTALGPDWANAGAVRIAESVLGGRIASEGKATWEGHRNVYRSGTTPPSGEVDSITRPLDDDSPMPSVGADPGAIRIPPRPVPHPNAGNIATLAVSVPGQ